MIKESIYKQRNYLNSICVSGFLTFIFKDNINLEY